MKNINLFLKKFNTDRILVLFDYSINKYLSLHNVVYTENIKVTMLVNLYFTLHFFILKILNGISINEIKILKSKGRKMIIFPKILISLEL